MRCPYCGHESETNHCSKCKAMIPEEKPKEETKDEPVKVRKKTRSE